MLGGTRQYIQVKFIFFIKIGIKSKSSPLGLAHWTVTCTRTRILIKASKLQRSQGHNYVIHCILSLQDNFCINSKYNVQESQDKQFLVQQLQEQGGGDAKKPPRKAIYDAAEPTGPAPEATFADKTDIP